MLKIEDHELTRAHCSAMRTIEQGRSAQKFSGPAFAAAAEELREMGLARITREGVERFYTLTPKGKRVLSAIGSAQIGGGL